MNFNWLINMITRRLMNWGLRRLSGPAKRRTPVHRTAAKKTPAAPMTAEQRQIKATREAVKRARQAARINRR